MPFLNKYNTSSLYSLILIKASISTGFSFSLCGLFSFFLFFFFFAKLCQDPLFLFVKTGHNTKLLAHPADTQATDARSAVEAFSSMFEK